MRLNNSKFQRLKIKTIYQFAVQVVPAIWEDMAWHGKLSTTGNVIYSKNPHVRTINLHGKISSCIGVIIRNLSSVRFFNFYEGNIVFDLQKHK